MIQNRINIQKFLKDFNKGENKYMTIDIVCEISFGKIKQLANDLEKNGFVPISMANEVIDNRNVMCIMMHKKE